jgi:uncharacterized membrane protein
MFSITGSAFFHALSFFWKFFGETEFILRLFPLLFGILSLVMTYRIGEYFFFKTAGIISALLVAVSPLHIWYSQEFTPYTALVFVSLLSVFLSLKIIRHDKNIYWIYLGITNVINVYLHPIAFLILFMEVLVFLFYWRTRKINRKKLLFYCALTIIFMVPFFYNFTNAFLENLKVTTDTPFYDYIILKNYWIPKPSIMSLAWTFKNFSVGYCSTFWLSLLGTGLYFVLSVYGMCCVGGKQKLFLILTFLFFPIVLVFLTSRFLPLYVDRYFISSSVFYYMLIANGLCNIKIKPLRVMLLVLVCFISFLGANKYFLGHLPEQLGKEAIGVQVRRDFAKANDYIARHYHSGDVIIHNTENTIPSFRYYTDRNKRFIKKPNQLLLYLPRNTYAPELYKYSTQQFRFQKIGILKEQYNNIWFVFAPDCLGDAHEADKLEWMDRNYVRKEEKVFQGIVVYLYKGKNE